MMTTALVRTRLRAPRRTGGREAAASSVRASLRERLGPRNTVGPADTILLSRVDIPNTCFPRKHAYIEAIMSTRTSHRYLLHGASLKTGVGVPGASGA